MTPLERMGVKGEDSKKIWIVIYFFAGFMLKSREIHMCIHFYMKQNLRLAHGLLTGLSVQSIMQILLTSFQG